MMCIEFAVFYRHCGILNVSGNLIIRNNGAFDAPVEVIKKNCARTVVDFCRLADLPLIERGQVWNSEC